ncbi:MAG: Na+/H+ antiporter subunit E [Microbacteriaceae bacterium]
MSQQKINFWYQLPLMAGLVLLWMLLWGDFSILSFLGGALIAVIVGIVFYLPRVQLAGRFNLWYFLVLGVVFFADVFIASFQVAFQAIWFGHQPKNAIVKVQMRSQDDMIMTLTAEAISLVPGTIVVEQDRNNGILYLHALNVGDLAGVEKVRRASLAQERRIILALGPQAELEMVRAEDALRGEGSQR